MNETNTHPSPDAIPDLTQLPAGDATPVMAAPAELAARGEWATSISVIVTTGGARVAGYRLLAFYP